MSIESTEISERLSSPLLAPARVAVFLTALAPAIVSTGFIFPFVTTRNVFFRICVEAALGLVVLTGVKRLREFEGSADPILKWFGFYLIAISFAAVFGLAPWHSVFGDFERMGGVWAWLHLFLFYLVLRILMRRSDWTVLFRCILAVADVVVIWGAFEFLPASIRNPLFQTTLGAGSTVGNPGLLAPYLLLTLAVSCLLLLEERGRWWRVFAVVSALMVLFGIAGSRNRSGELGLLFGVIAGASVFVAFSANRRRVALAYLRVGVLLILLATVGGYLLNRRAPEFVRHFGERWTTFLTSPIDQPRIVEWKIALEGFRDRPLLGYGPENHQIIASHHFDPRIYEVTGGGVFDRTHNAWIELLATTGLIGAAAMAGLWFATALLIRTALRQKRIRVGEAATLCGAFIGYAIYLTFWFFDINSAMVWVVLLGFLASRAHGTLDVFPRASEGRGSPILRWGTAALIAVAAYLHGIIPLVAAHDLSVGAGEGTFERRLGAFGHVMNSSAPQTLHTFPIYYRFLRSTIPFLGPGSDTLLRKEFDLAVQRGFIEASRHISRNKYDDRSYVDAARLSMLAGTYYQDARYLRLGRDQLLDAVRISPTRPDSRVLLSSVYLSLRDTAKAAAQLDSAIRFAPQYGLTYFFAAKLSLARNDVDAASSQLTAGLTHGFGRIDPVLADIVLDLEKRGEYLRAAKITEEFLERGFGPLSGWKRGTTPTGFALSSIAEDLANRLPILYLRGGDRTAAAKAATAFGAIKPEAAASVRRLQADIVSGHDSSWFGKRFVLPPPTQPSSTPRL